MARWHREPEPGDEPVLDIRPLSDDVIPLGDVYFIDETAPRPVEPEPPRPRERLGRPVVGSTLTCLGLVGTVVAAALPWSGGQGLPALRSVATGRSWVVWLLLAVAAAIVLGLLALIRPGRRTRWWGAGFAVAAAALSGWAVFGLPVDRAIGPGPGLAAVALALLAAGQVTAALAAPVEARWRWRSAGISAMAAVLVLAAAGFASSQLVHVQDVDATTVAGPMPLVTGSAPSVLRSELWRRDATVYDVAGSSAIVFGHAEHARVAMVGVSILDIRTGAERWHHYERGWTVVEAGLTADGRIATVVVNTATGTDAIGFDAASGAQLWRQRIADGYNCGEPAADQIEPIGGCTGQLITGDGVLFVNGAPTAGLGPDSVGAATYISARTGQPWRIPLGTNCRVRGAGGDTLGIYVLDQCITPGFPEPHLLSERVVAYDQDGHERWARPLALVKGTVAGGTGPVFVRGGVLLAQQEQTYDALDIWTGRLMWTTTDSLDAPTTVTDGARLVWASGVQVTTLDLFTGDQLWQRPWHFPDEADLPAIAGGHLYLIQHTIGPNPYSCAESAQMLLLDPGTGADAVTAAPLPDDAGNDCGPDVRDRMFLVGPLLVLVTANTITVLTG